MLPFALTRRGWSFACASVGLWVCSQVVGLGDLRYLAAFLLAMVLVAVASSLVLSALAGFDVRLSVPNPTPTVGEQSRVVLVVRHRLPMALPVQVMWETSAQTTSQSSRTPLVVPRASGAVASWILVPDSRGPQDVGLNALRVPDPLGLVVRRLRRNASAELLVLPRLLDALDEIDQMTRGEDAGAALRGRSADSAGPVGAVREYRTGDAMRQVHWKQSARQGELLVKVHDSEDAAQLSILLVTDAAAYATAAEFEAAVSAVATVAARWLGEGHPVQLHIGDTSPHRCTGRGEMLRHLASVHLAPVVAEEDGAPAEPSMLSAVGGRGSVDVVVAGTVSSQVARRIESTRFSGTLLTPGATASDSGASGWRTAAISSSAPAAAQRGERVGERG